MQIRQRLFIWIGNNTMKSKLIKIGILLPVCFGGIFWGCGDNTTIRESYYTLQEVKTAVKKQGNDWKTIQLYLEVRGLFDKSVKITQQLKNYTGSYVTASTLAFTSTLKFTENIDSYKLRILSPEKNLDKDVETDLGQSLSEYIEMINTGFAPEDKNFVEKVAPNLEKDTIVIPRIFYFKKEPLFLKDKDVRIEFSIKTKEGNVFADTTKVVHLDW